LPTYGIFDEKVAQTLLEAGANVNARDDRGQTALMHAARYGYENTVKLLIEHRADVNLRDNLGRTALMHAAAGK
jgi:ankyrin repeat protein